MKNTKTMTIYSSRFPFSIFIAIPLQILTISIFSYHWIEGQINFIYALAYILFCLMLIDLIICRYAGKIIITEEKIKIKYFFPWRSSITIDIKDIEQIETQSPYKKLYSKIFIRQKDSKISQINIQSWYKSIDGIKTIEKEFKKTAVNR